MKQKILSNDNIAAVCVQLGHLIHAGIRLSQGASLLEGNPAAALLSEKLEEGLPLWNAMEAAGCFPQGVAALVRIGEESGRLEEALFALADYYEMRCRTGKLLQNTLRYPAMTLSLMLLVVGVLLVKVLPIFDQVYASLGSRLTGVAAGLLQLGSWIKGGLPMFFGLLALALILALLYAKWEAFRRNATLFWQRKFGDRGVSRKFNNARFVQGIAMAITSGMAMEEAVDLAAELIGDPGGKQRCRSCADAIRNGKSLANALKENALLDSASCALLDVGIRGGSADTILADIAKKQMFLAQVALESVISKMEPTLVMTASILVGMILLSVMLPLMDILSVLG